MSLLLSSLQTAEDSCEVCQRAEVGGGRAESTVVVDASHAGRVCEMWP